MALMRLWSPEFRYTQHSVLEVWTASPHSRVRGQESRSSRDGVIAWLADKVVPTSP